jgi:hypothetical protein
MDYNLASFTYDEKIRKTLEREGANFYSAITRIYRLPVKATNAKPLLWKLKLSDDLKKDLPEALILQPRTLAGCEQGRK